MSWKVTNWCDFITECLLIFFIKLFVIYRKSFQSECRNSFFFSSCMWMNGVEDVQLSDRQMYVIKKVFGLQCAYCKCFWQWDANIMKVAYAFFLFSCSIPKMVTVLALWPYWHLPSHCQSIQFVFRIHISFNYKTDYKQ